MSKINKNPDELIEAICKSFDGVQLTPSQEQALTKFKESNSLDDLPMNCDLLKEIEDMEDKGPKLFPIYAKKINAPDQAKKSGVIKHISYKSIAIAACIFFIAGLLIILLLISDTNISRIFHRKSIVSQKILPGGLKATLILSNNRSIELGEQQKGELAKEGGTSIQKTDSGMLVYETFSNKRNESYINNLITPRAGTYTVTLPDRTVMHLNAETSVSYPAEFNGPNREVILMKVEDYFEVAHRSKPFIVKTNNFSVNVLGTEFNINSYLNDSLIKTTLIKGSIKLKKDDQEYVLKPKQQAIMSQNGEKLKIIDNVNTDEVTLWKDGFFSFNKLDLKTIMHQVERWYDVDVIFEEELESDPLTVNKLPRSFTLQQFLDILSEGGRFNYKITSERKVIIRR